MKENGKMIKKMDMEYFISYLEINMKENGKIIYLMDMGYIIFTILIGNIKENGKINFLMDMVFYIFQKEYYMKENRIKLKNLVGY